MNLRLFQEVGQASGHHAVLLFGAGLIGASILAHLPGRYLVFDEDLPEWSWTEQEKRSEAVRASLDKIARVRGLNRLSVVWSAGAGGFNAPEAELKAEFEAFRDVVSIAGAARRVGNIVVDFHLVSSAGGLFEGARMVSARDVPQALRPYAESKIRQEAYALEVLDSGTGLHIYRPSSVYGFQPGGRVNLVSALIENGYRRRTSTIYGKLSTLRDFVFVEDVGREIAGNILSPERARSCRVIASGKPSSMLEVIQVVQSVVQYPLQIRYDKSFNNALDNSFRTSVAGSPARRTPLRLGVLRTADAWKRSVYLTPARQGRI